MPSIKRTALEGLPPATRYWKQRADLVKVFLMMAEPILRLFSPRRIFQQVLHNFSL
jgi:hypothetical protein